MQQISTLKQCTVLVVLAVSAFSAESTQSAPQWVGSWAASQQLVETQNTLPSNVHGVTLRQIVHLSQGGKIIRLHLSNRFGDLPLHFTAVHAAIPVTSASDKIAPDTDRSLTFSGTTDVIIPAHADYISDPLQFQVSALSNLTITLHLDTVPTEQTGHPGSRATSYFVQGDHVAALELPQKESIDHRYFIAGIDVVASPNAAAVVVLGDSITDGHGATTNGNDRWTDVLAARLQSGAGTGNLAILNQGIGGNRVITDGLGPNALSRFDHDVIAQPGVRYLIVLEGINDIGMLTRTGEVPRAEHDALVRRLIAAYQQMIARAHDHSIKVIGATILPFSGSSFYHPAPLNESDRQAINEWIRGAGYFDAVLDFDKLTRDPQHPDQLLPAFDSGDHLHPSPAGYAAMGQAVPLSFFTPQ